MNQSERRKIREKELSFAKIEKTKELINNKKNPQCCEFCKSTFFVSDHHIIKKAEDDYKFNSVVENLVRVCQKCHERFHAYDSEYLSAKNKELFVKCMIWLIVNYKFVTHGKFMAGK